MFEYEAMNKETRETIFIYGHNWQDALRKHPKFNPDEWEVIRSDYADYMDYDD